MATYKLNYEPVQPIKRRCWRVMRWDQADRKWRPAQPPQRYGTGADAYAAMRAMR